MQINDQNELTRPQLTRTIISLLGLKSKSRIYPSTSDIMVHCPFHTDKTPSMGIDINAGIYHCFSCGRSGSIESLYKDLTGDSIYKVLGIKNDPFSVFSRYTYTSMYPEKNDTVKKGIYINYDKNSLVPALENINSIQYLDKRHILYSIAEASGFMYAENTTINTTLFKNRLCIPIYENGILSSIEGRRINDNDLSPKVLYPKNTSVDLLYDIDNLKKDDRLYACEGLMDLFILRSCKEFSNSTSVFGANITKRQIEQFKNFKEVVYIYDLDTAGLKTVEQLRDSGLENVYVLKLPDEIRGTKIKDIEDLPKAGSSPSDLVSRKWLSYLKKLN